MGIKDVGYYLALRPFSEAWFNTWFLYYVCLDNTSSESLLFIFLLDETEMGQNNSVFGFVRKTSNDSCGKPNLRNDMNQVTNLKSLVFSWKKIAYLLGFSTSFWSLCFWKRPFCGRRCYKTSVCISCCRSRWFTYTNPMKLSDFTFPPPLVLGSNLSNSCLGDCCWFSSINPFAMFAKSINDFTISFWVFSLFMIPMQWSLAVFTVLLNWLLGRFALRVYLQVH